MWRTPPACCGLMEEEWMRTAQWQVPVRKTGKSETPRVHLSPLKPHRREPKSCQTAAACGVRDLGSWLEQAATCSALEPPTPCVSAGQLRAGLEQSCRNQEPPPLCFQQKCSLQFRRISCQQHQPQVAPCFELVL